MKKSKAIETELGILHGRDCIYLDSVEQDDCSNLIFIGEINSNLVLKKISERAFIPYILTFEGEIAHFSCELDTYGNLEYENRIDEDDYIYESSFDLIDNSVWLDSLPIREDFDKSEYKHYHLSTYDIVYDIIATSYQLDIDVDVDPFYSEENQQRLEKAILDLDTGKS